MTTPVVLQVNFLMAVILAFFIFTKTPQGDWNIKKGGNLMSKRNHARSNRRTTRPANESPFPIWWFRHTLFYAFSSIYETIGM